MKDTTKVIDNFFNNEADRDLWLKLNAEHQIEWEKSLTWFDSESQTYKPTRQAMNPRSMEAALTVARNQLDCDIEKGVLRKTLEDYLTKDFESLNEMSKEAHRKFIKDFTSLKLI